MPIRIMCCFLTCLLAGSILPAAEPSSSTPLDQLANGVRETYAVTLHAEARVAFTLTAFQGGDDLVLELYRKNGKWLHAKGGGWEGNVVSYKWDKRKNSGKLVLSISKDGGDKIKPDCSLTAALEAGEGTGSYKNAGEGSCSFTSSFTAPLGVDGNFAYGKGLTFRLSRIDGVWQSGAGAQSMGFNQGASSAQVTDTTAGLEAVRLAANIGSDNWVKGDPGAEYILAITQNVDGVSGSFTGSFQGQPCSGTLSGSRVVTGWQNTTADKGGERVHFKLGSHKANWNNARWVPYEFAKPVDISAYDGLQITIETDTPREDVWIDVGVNEHDGTWYYLRDAIPLNQTSNTALVPFSAMRHAEWIFNAAGTGAGADGNYDEDFALDLQRVLRIAIGVINQHGVGEVQFRIANVDFAKWLPEHDGKASVTVTGETMQINGQRQIPTGMFGYHVAGNVDYEAIKELKLGSLRHHRAMAMGGHLVTKANPDCGIDFTVNCQYDRAGNQIHPNAHSADWEQKMRSAGAAIGAAAAQLGDQYRIEWWNEPYLDFGKMLEGPKVRWEERQKLASKFKISDDIKDGDPVTAAYGRQFESLNWKVTVDEATGQKWLQAKDPTRFTYWSGRQIAILYTETFLAMAEEATKKAPEVMLIPGFGFRWQEDDWECWDILYKYMIDNSHQYIHGINEHHYQGHTEGMAGGYEALQAYMVTKYDKPVKFYNTETNDLWDSPARGNAAGSKQKGQYIGRKRMVYNARDILYCLKECPDKAEARAIHAIWGPIKDNRVEPGGSNNVDGVDVVAGEVSFAEQLGDTAAGEGKIFVLVPVSLTNADKRKKSKTFQADVLIVKTSGATHKVGPTEVEGHTLGKTKLKHGEQREGTIAYAIPANAKDGIMTMKPGKKAKKVSHVSGEFIPFNPAPHQRCGIDKGEYDALYFMRKLRGQLVRADSSDEQVWAVSSINADQQLVTIVFNDSWDTRTVDLKLAAPQGTSFKAGRKSHMRWWDENGRTDGGAEEDLAVDGTSFTHSVELGPSRAVCIALDLDGTAATEPVLTQRQIFAGPKDRDNAGILFPVAAGKTVSLPIELPENATTAKRAWVKVVLERCGDRDGYLSLGGEQLPLPAAWTPCNSSFIRHIAIDPAKLAGLKELTFGGHGPEQGGNGYMLCMASVVIEH